MPASKARSLSSIFKSAIKSTAEKPSSLTSTADDHSLKQFVSSLDTSTASPIISISKKLIKSPKPKSSAVRKHVADVMFPSLELSADWNLDDSGKQVSEEIRSILCDGASVSPPDQGESTNEKVSGNILEIPWFSAMSDIKLSSRRKDVLRERKQKWIFKNTQGLRFNRLVTMCAQKLGTEATVAVFGKLGRETGVKEYNALIKICVENARTCDNEDVALEQISKAFQFFSIMKEQGFKLEEETYGPLLLFLIDMGMIQEFHFFSEMINNGNPSAAPRLGYYEMLLYIGVNDQNKIQELCTCVAINDEDELFSLKENYLLALCENDRKDDYLLLLDTIDITKLSSSEHVESVFKSFGRLNLDSFAENHLLAFKKYENGAKQVSDLIFSYSTSIPNIEVEDIVSKFHYLHSKLEIMPSTASYVKLIKYNCDLGKVHVALDVVDQMCEAGLTPSMDALNSVLQASDESYEFNLVQRVYAIICRYDLKPNTDSIRSMISLRVKMKDFTGAYDLLKDVKNMNMMPTASMYNAIISGYFRKKDKEGALSVLKQMELADVKPDSQTYSYLIQNCENEKDIIKYYEELKVTGVQLTKHVYMALINAYATCGQLEKAKEVALDKAVPVKSLNEIKGVLISALASHGQFSDAFTIHEEVKQAGLCVEPKSIIALIEYTRSEEELNRSIQLLEELHDPEYWIDGCCRLLSHSVRLKHLSFATALLKQLMDKVLNDELVMEVVLDETFCLIAQMELTETAEPTHLQIGLDILHIIKNELHLLPSRKSLDFLLNACVNARDLKSSWLVWKEYQTSSLPYNVLSFLRMYQALLASGDHKAAKKMMHKIPKDDPDVRHAIYAYRKAYINSTTGKAEKTRKPLRN